MKIGLMSAWNQTSGTSVHAELVGREWVKMGHSLRVFSFIESDFHGSFLMTGTDEIFVTRCFGTSQRTNYLNPTPFLEEKFDVFVVEDLGMLPKDNLAKIFPRIREYAKMVHVVHDARLSEDPSFYQFDWDAMVCFDERYERLLTRVYPKEMVYIIPFPCMPWREGDKEAARRRLDLPLDKKIIFLFGQKWRHIQNEVPVLVELSKKYPLLILVVSGSPRVSIDTKGLEVIIRREVMEIDRLYEYLHASDAFLYDKRPTSGAVLSSTAHLIFGSACPLVVRDSNFFEMMDSEVMKFKDTEELRANLTSAFEKDERYEDVKEKARAYVEKNSADKVARRLVEHFESLTSVKR